jgi:hypothetical protein
MCRPYTGPHLIIHARRAPTLSVFCFSSKMCLPNLIYNMPPIFRSYFVVCRKNTLATIWKQVCLVQLYRVLQSYAENTLATICKQIGFCHFTTKSETSLPFTTINMTSYLIGYTFDVTSCSLPHTWIIFFKYFPFRALANFPPSNISTK